MKTKKKLSNLEREFRIYCLETQEMLNSMKLEIAYLRQQDKEHKGAFEFLKHDIDKMSASTRLQKAPCAGEGTF